jgi:Prenyltransferase and squalene oxidase repeat
MGKLMALGAAVVALASPAQFLQSRQQPGGGYAEANGTAYPQLTAWAVLGLRAQGADVGNALAYLVAHESELAAPTDLALVALAEAALGRDPATLLARLPTGPTQVNVAIWSILAHRQAGRPARAVDVRYLLRSQAPNGGFSWARGGRPDSNDTSAAIQALRAAGVKGKPIARALAFLRTFANRDGGFELQHGRGSDAPSTAWAIQAFVAAGARLPPAAFRYLASLARPDGSYRYSRAYAATPVWVTAQVLPAVARKPFPLSPR